MDGLGDGVVVGGQHLAQVLRVEAGRERGRAREVAEQHRELPPLRAVPVRAMAASSSAGRRLRGGRLRRRLGTTRGRSGAAAQRGDGGEQPAAVAHGGHADFPQVVSGELGQHVCPDVVVAERRLVPAEAEAAQPSRYVRHRPLVRSGGATPVSATGREEPNTAAAKIAASLRRVPETPAVIAPLRCLSRRGHERMRGVADAQRRVRYGPRTSSQFRIIAACRARSPGPVACPRAAGRPTPAPGGRGRARCRGGPARWSAVVRAIELVLGRVRQHQAIMYQIADPVLAQGPARMTG